MVEPAVPPRPEPRRPSPRSSALERLRDRWGDPRVRIAALLVAALVAGLVWYQLGVRGSASAGAGAERQRHRRPPRPANVRRDRTTRRARPRRASRAGPWSSTSPARSCTRASSRLDAGARVIDAIQAAGGGAPDADLDRLNLAAKVADGQRIAVAVVGAPTPSAVDSPTPDGGAGGGGSTATGPVNLNTATESQLEALPGIGPSLAAAIIAEREKRGGFKASTSCRTCAGSARCASPTSRTWSRCDHHRAAGVRSPRWWRASSVVEALRAADRRPSRWAPRSRRSRPRCSCAGASASCSLLVGAALLGSAVDAAGVARARGARRSSGPVARRQDARVEGSLVDDPSGPRFVVEALARSQRVDGAPAGSRTRAARRCGRRHDAAPGARGGRPGDRDRHARAPARLRRPATGGATRSRSCDVRELDAFAGPRSPLAPASRTRPRAAVLRGADGLPATRARRARGLPPRRHPRHPGRPRRRLPERRPEPPARGVSGANVAFVLAVAGAAARAGCRLGSRFVVGLLVLVLFGTMTRWEPSVLRACAMAGLAMAATVPRPAGAREPDPRARRRSGSLVADPFLLHSVGFLLSCGASAGIVGLGARDQRARVPGPQLVRRGARRDRWPRSSASLPVLLPVFGTVPLVALPANLLAAPMVGPLTVWGLVAGVVGGLVGPGSPTGSSCRRCRCCAGSRPWPRRSSPSHRARGRRPCRSARLAPSTLDGRRRCGRCYRPGDGGSSAIGRPGCWAADGAVGSESMPRFRLGDVVHDLTDRTLVMGILNRTPDSFYDAGETFALDALVRRAEELVDAGRRPPRRRRGEGRARARGGGGGGARPGHPVDRGGARALRRPDLVSTPGGRRCSTRRARPAPSSATTSAASPIPSTSPSPRSTRRRSSPPTSASPRVSPTRSRVYDDLVARRPGVPRSTGRGARRRPGSRRSRSRSTPGSTSARRRR